MKISTPILISSPHSGTAFPSEVKSFYKEEVIENPRDTDWFVDQLYSFSSELGIELVSAPYSRYVIDLNRDPMSKSLYSDSRSETSLVTEKSFLGEDILKKKIPKDEIARRAEAYYWPYYKMIQEKLDQRIKLFGHALLFDAHSIKRIVPTISEKAFPDLILGNNDQTSASQSLITTALKSLSEGPFEVKHNSPFKGGHITRYFGVPEKNQHALQLEMSQDLYMDEEKTVYDEVKASKMILVLKNMFEDLLEELKNESL